ncbi:L-histidine N(alpha)-methyltransferase [Alkalihalobacillus deserti]|uniref:L-histidine N(alpha)-methyltransferase n=1 Tax=Alkalihalobacillus deserti TaxID=2879466 RepID=UPI001D138C6B|nr:L-histidine N(alpha)-methyltransferase [Alkalihalobacillus deserti]
MTQTVHAITDMNPSLFSLKEEVLTGLRQNQKQLHPKLFYDENGSRLFNQITTLPEYYLTRAEKEILTTFHADICAFIGHNTPLIELGCGSEEKIQLILESLKEGNRYIPIDISQEALQCTVEKLLDAYPLLDVNAIRADYTQALSFLCQGTEEKKVVLFLGSTIGNFDENDRNEFLQQLAQNLNPDDGLIIGIDLKKSPTLLEAAYNDSAGITAAFNKNLLDRINRELNANFQVENFAHHAFFNNEKSRIEMHLVSKTAQEVSIDEEIFSFDRGETIHTENSYKFDLEDFQQTLNKAGLGFQKAWSDQHNHFALTYIEPLKG